jgi:hypothetical protein
VENVKIMFAFKAKDRLSLSGELCPNFYLSAKFNIDLTTC